MMMMMMMMMNAVLCLVGKNRIQRMFFFARISVFAQEVTMFAGKITVFFPGKNDHVCWSKLVNSPIAAAFAVNIPDFLVSKKWHGNK